MRTLVEYFAMPDTPAPDSPVARVMQQLVMKRAETYGADFETARAEANRLIQEAARRKCFSLPTVLTLEQEDEAKAASKAYWESRPVAQHIHE